MFSHAYFQLLSADAFDMCELIGSALARHMNLSSNESKVASGKIGSCNEHGSGNQLSFTAGQYYEY